MYEKTNDSWRRRHCRRVIWIIISYAQHYGWRWISLWVICRNQSLKSEETKSITSPSESHHCNQTLSLSSSRYSQLFRFVALKQPNINFNMSTPINQKLKSSWSSRILTLRLPRFFEAVLLPNSTMSSNVRSWTWEFSNSKISLRTNVQNCALGLLNCLGANEGTAKRGKSVDDSAYKQHTSTSRSRAVLIVNNP
jgi:hypothetical protein